MSWHWLDSDDRLVRLDAADRAQLARWRALQRRDRLAQRAARRLAIRLAVVMLLALLAVGLLGGLLQVGGGV